MKSSAVSALFWGAALGAIKVDLNDTSELRPSGSFKLPLAY